MQGYLPVTDKGAKCDGETNDSEAWSAAINAVADGGGGTVVMPQGISRCPSGLTMRSGVHIVGVSGRGSVIDCTGADTAVSLVGSLSSHLRTGGLERLTVQCDGDGIVFRYARPLLRINEVTIEGAGSGVAILFDGVAHEITLENILAKSFARGIVARRNDQIGQSSNANRIRGVKLYGISTCALEIDRCQDNVITDLNIAGSACEECAIRLHGETYPSMLGHGNKMLNVRIGDCDGIGNYAVELDGVMGTMIQNFSTQKLAVGAVRMTGAYQNMIFGLSFKQRGAGQLVMDQASIGNYIIGGYVRGDETLPQYAGNTVIDIGAAS